MNILVSIYRLKAETQTGLDKFVAETIISAYNSPTVVSGIGYSKEEAIVNLKKNLSKWEKVEFHSVDISDILNLNLTKSILDV